MHHSTLRTLALAVCLWPWLAGAAVYTFDNLNPGQLSGSGTTTGGQDNWRTINTNNSSYVVKAGTGSDTTLIAGNPGTDNGSGSDVHINGRTNDGNFSFGNLTGATGLTLAFDTQVHNITSGAEEFINFGLGDATDAHGSSGFAYFQIPGGQPSFAVGNPAGGGTSGSLPSTPTNDWIRLSFMMDFTANGGQGTGTFTYQDLTLNPNGQPQTITSGFNLQGSGANASFWNTMWSRSDFDSGVVLDNLTVIPTFAIPEVRSAWIAGACGLLLGAHFLRRRQVLNRASIL
jgi:hypothetical protein